MTSINVKMDLIKLDMVVKDIHHLWSEVPSSYLFPKSVLSESRAAVRTDVRKALVLAQKAQKLFQAESVVATRYAQISGMIPFAGESARFKDTEYSQSIAAGEYDKASGILDELTSLVLSCDGVEPHLSAELVSSDEAGCVVLFRNSGDFSISIMGSDVSSGSERVRTDPRNTFTIAAKSSRKMTISAPSPVHIVLQYNERGESKSFETEL